jgi:hypothetical protein
MTLAEKTGPTFTSAELTERAIHRRAVEAAIWGMPAVNYQLMYQEMVDKVKAGSTRSCIGHGCWTGRTRR